jgi:inner membrane protease ATP23
MAPTTQTQEAPLQPTATSQAPKPTESSPTTAAPQAGGGSASEKEPKEQKAFERWTRTLSLITGIGLSQEEFQAEIDKIERKKCELRKEQLIKTSKQTY